jgi:hypothetical protein
LRNSFWSFLLRHYHGSAWNHTHCETTKAMSRKSCLIIELNGSRQFVTTVSLQPGRPQ